MATSARLMAAAGVALVLGSVLTIWLGFGRVSVHFYLPNWPVVQALDNAHESAGAAPQPATGMFVDIPAINVHAPVDKVGNDASGHMAAPVAWFHAGWYDHGPRPGQAGVAIIEGHVDSHTGPAVFFHLHQLEPGDEISVTDGATITDFDVVKIHSYPETAVPLQQIFANGGPPRLVLLTCSGDFNPVTHRYNDRLVVSARSTP